ncbi:MAG: lysophospholipid acyltransferase family protein [Syntrophaceae bacterium]|nr:lysophospholipid acyltransferase family protein [Syntrophaceae bacterium]
MQSLFEKIVKTGLFHILFFWVVNIYSLTFRFRLENEDAWLRRLERGERVLLCTWHQQFFSAVRPFQKYRKYNPVLMISQSSDGDIVAGVANKSGWHVVRGSSSRGGKEALRGMIEQLQRSGLAAHIVDGPRGPAGRVKEGVIQLAQSADAVIVPFYINANRAWYFNSWDRFMLPKPFSKVTLSFGEGVKLMPAQDQDVFENQRLDLEGTMLPYLSLDSASR